ncbi:MAG: hypothetical protein RIQ53_369 [Pseudomonadota bacterium]|jgi:hypothetical protein
MQAWGLTSVWSGGPLHPPRDSSMQTEKMMEWIPIGLFTFKIIVLGVGMFFAIKWHHDQAKNKKK